jgi:hypothetical protein
MDVEGLPPVHVITLAKDDESGLLLSRGSVAGQTYARLRHTIVTAPSRDDTVSAARRLARDGRVELCENAPRGIYMAMNFALNLTENDEWVLFLNSGDFFLYPHAIEQLAMAGRQMGSPWATGAFVTVGPRGWVRDVVPEDWLRSGCDVGHQATLALASELKGLGGFDTKYRVFADGKLLRELRSRHEPGIVGVPSVAYALGGYSTLHPKIVAAELDLLDSEVPGMATTRRAPTSWHRTLSRLVIGTGAAQRILPFFPNWALRPRGSRSRRIQSVLVGAPHWRHERTSAGSLACCKAHLPRTASHW